MDPAVVQDLPHHVQLVLAAIARALNGKHVSPANMAKIAGQIRGCLKGHITRTEHKPRPPKGTRPRLKAVYTITVTGHRIDGRWDFSPGQFEELLRDARKRLSTPQHPLSLGRIIMLRLSHCFRFRS